MIGLAEYLETEPMGAIVAERETSLERRKLAALTRRYAAAKVSSLNSGWTTQPTVANYEIRDSIRALRARARQFARDNAHGRTALRKSRINVIGRKGLQLQCQAYKKNLRGGQKQLDTALNEAVELAFWEWSKNPAFCSTSGKLNFVRAQKLAITQLKRDGEILCEMRKADNPFGFSIRMLNCDYLDETYNKDLGNGNRIIMSIEINSDWKPVAYHLTTPTSNITFAPNRERKRVRVPAEQMIHAFYVTEDEEQVRGVTSFHAALLNAKHTAGYLESVIVGARAGASQIAVIEEEYPTDPDNDPRTQCYADKTEEEIAAMREPKVDLTPGTISRLAPGQKMTSWNPNQPNQNHPEFFKSLNIEEAAALDLPYFSMSGDMESVNFSSSRVGKEDEREVYLDDQDFIGDFFCTPIFHAWLKSAWMSGAITLQPRDFDELRFPKWRGRGWPFIQPDKDVKATADAIAFGLQTPSGAIEDRGEDFEEFLQTYLRDTQKMDEMRIKFANSQANPATAEPTDNPNDSGDEPKASDKKKKDK